MFNFEIFSRMAREVHLASGYSYTAEEALSVFKYFFEELESHTGRPHTPISRANAARIMGKMPRTEDGIALEPDQYLDLIDRYFETDFPDCDYRINHFFSGRIRDNRLPEVMYDVSDVPVSNWG